MSDHYGTASGPRITAQGSYGQFQTTPFAFDMLIAKYLPASVNELNAIITERRGEEGDPYATVTECLMVLAEYDGYATN